MQVKNFRTCLTYGSANQGFITKYGGKLLLLDKYVFYVQLYK